ncbi:MAG: histidine phosphatase family protein [Ruminococcaceae bacterium]|nr:histidine phosphatase family protein [Oscillospiraceae bacterium]
MKTYKIHLIRHAMTSESQEGKYIGHTDVPLSEAGVAQLESMKEEYIYPVADVVFSSPLSRCTDTARILYPEAQIVTIDELIEYNFGEFEGRTAEELHEKEELFDDWLRGERDVEPPFGESNADFAKRVCTAFAAIAEGIMKAGTEDTVIVTHGGVIMTIMAAFALPEASMHEWLTPNGCGYTLRLTPTLWMAGQKVEAIEEIPAPERKQENYYDGWDWYPDVTDEDFDISEYINE